MTEQEQAKYMVEKGIDVLCEAFPFTFQILKELNNNQFDYIIGKYPDNIDSDQEPPKKLAIRAEIIPVDEYLGLYEPKKRKITIFNKGIEHASSIINCNPGHLKYIVKLHEESHAFVHISFDENDTLQVLNDDSHWKEQLKRATKIYNSIENKLHENIAQLLTYHSLLLIRENAQHDEAREIVNKIITIFLELTRRQPVEYVVNEYLEVPTSRIIQSVKLIKKELLRGTFDVWSTIIKW